MCKVENTINQNFDLSVLGLQVFEILYRFNPFLQVFFLYGACMHLRLNARARANEKRECA